MGYHRSGFDVVGVDIKPQPNYPFEFHRGDAIEFVKKHGHKFDAIAASPPCQSFTAYRRKGHGVGEGYLNLIPDTRRALEATGLPYIIENVEQARAHLRDPMRLCGSMFGLDVQRHRLFESNILLSAPTPCNHAVWSPRFPPATNRTNLRKTVEVGVWRIPLATQRVAMGVDWMELEELSQALPPAYTQHLGSLLLASISSEGKIVERAPFRR